MPGKGTVVSNVLFDESSVGWDQISVKQFAVVSPEPFVHDKFIPPITCSAIEALRTLGAEGVAWSPCLWSWLATLGKTGVEIE